jgi:UDP-N-acetyl-D-galactosamine dehydrogenase
MKGIQRMTASMPAKIAKIKVCVVGLGYVGLPIAVKFGQTGIPTFGFDINQKKIRELRSFQDSMNEVASEELRKTKVEYSSESSIIGKANFIIVAVPTPVDEAKQPDITLLRMASETVGRNMRKGSIVVFESTVYPGCTEDDCVPIIEKFSSLRCGRDWFIGYSPERINPGDKEHSLTRVVKVVSGMDAKTLDVVAAVYGQVAKAGVFRASSIKVAEAAKVIENTQRDLNIALMNELSLIFSKMDISTRDVLEAAGTKWNFHRYTPGLVGGHCIGVDPYYLTHKAEMLGYHPRVILAGRQINDDMASHVAQMVVKGLNKIGKVLSKSRILILGLTFKENVKDSRNSKTKDLIHELKDYGVEVIACDPYLSQHDVDEEHFDVTNVPLKKAGKVDGIILTVPHKEFVAHKLNHYAKFYRNGRKGKKLFVDIKGFYDARNARKNGYMYISL